VWDVWGHILEFLLKDEDQLRDQLRKDGLENAQLVCKMFRRLTLTNRELYLRRSLPSNNHAITVSGAVTQYEIKMDSSETNGIRITQQLTPCAYSFFIALLGIGLALTNIFLQIALVGFKPQVSFSVDDLPHTPDMSCEAVTQNSTVSCFNSSNLFNLPASHCLDNYGFSLSAENDLIASCMRYLAFRICSLRQGGVYFNGNGSDGNPRNYDAEILCGSSAERTRIFLEILASSLLILLPFAIMSMRMAKTYYYPSVDDVARLVAARRLQLIEKEMTRDGNGGSWKEYFSSVCTKFGALFSLRKSPDSNGTAPFEESPLLVVNNTN